MNHNDELVKARRWTKLPNNDLIKEQDPKHPLVRLKNKEPFVI